MNVRCWWSLTKKHVCCQTCGCLLNLHIFFVCIVFCKLHKNQLQEMASTSSIVDITTEESFSQAVAGKSACVHFEAAWCAPCVEMNKICAQLAVKYPQVAFFKLDAENLSNITEKFGIAAVPAFVFLRVWKIVNNIYIIIEWCGNGQT